MKQSIAIIGSGISGLASAYWLSNKYHVSLFEANDCLGGHTHTEDVTIKGTTHRIDTGFIVFNDKTYPNFMQLMQHHHVPMQKSEMSFSCRSDILDMEYNGHNLNTIFADRRHLLNIKFYQFLANIIRFNSAAKKYLATNRDDLPTLKDFIEHHQFSSIFIDLYLLPMVESIWSKNRGQALNSPTHFILQFCENHGLLNYINRPQWYVVKNGSSSYIPKLIKPLEDRIYLHHKINAVVSKDNSIEIHTDDKTFNFDKVVIATHSDQALAMLTAPSEAEIAVLSGIKYTSNEVCLHTDARIMPKRKLAWASWNYLCDQEQSPKLTYYMNRLQSIDAPEDIFVSVNLTKQLDPHKILKKFSYAHPSFDANTMQAQSKYDVINGQRNIYYCGAYWGYGFHEDGVNSAIKVCRSLGVSVP